VLIYAFNVLLVKNIWTYIKKRKHYNNQINHEKIRYARGSDKFFLQ